MKVWKNVQRAVFDRATCEVGCKTGTELLDEAEMLQRVVMMEAACVVLSGRCCAGLCRERWRSRALMNVSCYI